MDKHTPAPWTIYEDESPIIMANLDGENYDIAALPDDYLPQDEVQANARLIAAAPEMLNALHKAEDHIEQLCNIVNDLAGFRKVRSEDFKEDVRAAIIKAT